VAIKHALKAKKKDDADAGGEKFGGRKLNVSYRIITILG
jgi:hypothetical protein